MDSSFINVPSFLSPCRSLIEILHNFCEKFSPGDSLKNSPLVQAKSFFVKIGVLDAGKNISTTRVEVGYDNQQSLWTSLAHETAANINLSLSHQLPSAQQSAVPVRVQMLVFRKSGFFSSLHAPTTNSPLQNLTVNSLIVSVRTNQDDLLSASARQVIMLSAKLIEVSCACVCMHVMHVYVAAFFIEVGLPKGDLDPQHLIRANQKKVV